MITFTRALTVAFAAILMSILAPFSAAFSAPVEVTWGGIPGGATFSSSGGPYQSAPLTWQLTAADNSQYDQLWFSFDNIAAGMDNTASELTFVSGIGGATAIWEGADTLLGPGSNPIPILTRFVATLASGTWIDPADVGISGPDAVAEWITNPFEITFSLLASVNGGATWNSFFGTFDNNNCGVSCQGFAKSEFVTRYFYTEDPAANAQVPLPAGLVLLATGIGILGSLKIRRRITG